MSIYRIRVRRDSSGRWSSLNPVLGLGEAGFETDTRKLKVGDGTTTWNSLLYVAYEVSPHNQEISTINGLQYALDSKSDESHTHVIADITGLSDALNGLSPLNHSHYISDITNLQSELNLKSAVGHTHSISEINTLQSVLDSKAEAFHLHTSDQVTATGYGGEVFFNTSGLFNASPNFLYDLANQHLRVGSVIESSGLMISPHFQGGLLGPVQSPVKNTSGGPIGKGVPVYITGTVGATTTLEIDIARADTSAKMPAVGVTETYLANNGTGHITIVGTLGSLDTSLFTAGQTVYVGPTGGLVNSRPTGVNILVQNIGKVGRSNSNNGEIIITGPGRTNDVPNSLGLNSLYDVQTSGVVSGQALIYNGSYWSYGSVSASGASGGGFTTSVSAPSTGSLSEGYRWLDSGSGIEFTLVNDGDGLQWVELPSVSYNGSSTAASGSSGSSITDGNKGDITVSATGTIWTINSGVVETSNLGGDITTAGKALLDDADSAAQRTTLGLGTAAVASTGDFAAASHTHSISGIVASGTPSSSTFLRGDSYWTTPSITDSINIAINSTPDVISTGSKGFKAIPYNCEVTDWFIFSSATGSIEFDIKRSSYSNYPTTVSIIGSTGEKPVLSNSIKNKYETLTSWSGLSQGDVIEFWITSCSGLQDVSLCMKTRTI